MRRAYGIYYSQDKQTGQRESFKTTSKDVAERMLAAKNQSAEQPLLNKGMAKVYLSATAPEFVLRTWRDVMDRYVDSGVQSTRDRKERAFRSRPFLMLEKIKLIETSAEHLFAVLEHKKAGNSTHHYLKRLHNYALHLGWLLGPVMAEAAWPAIRTKKFLAITEEEHERIIAKETNLERRLYYALLWETGGSQSDIANLTWKRVDKVNGVIEFERQKLEGKSGGASSLKIGPRIQRILDQLPRTGDFFPKLKQEKSWHRSSEFARRCKTLKITKRTLHSYRYAWAQRARTAGMPERDAMNHLGHKSRAIHAAYGAGANPTVLPLEFYETEKAKNIVRFDGQTDTSAKAS